MVKPGKDYRVVLEDVHDMDSCLKAMEEHGFKIMYFGNFHNGPKDRHTVISSFMPSNKMTPQAIRDLLSKRSILIDIQTFNHESGFFERIQMGDEK